MCFFEGRLRFLDCAPPLTWCMNRTGAPPQRGSIVNISSILGRVGNATNGSVSPQHNRSFGVSI
jgi:hypothetical protein